MLLETAMNAAHRYGMLPPAAELARLGIPLNTIVRVLTQPCQSRARPTRIEPPAV